ncbi:glycosyltransferase [Sinorhizobium sp. BG8]|uniref:glycosyltransferase n=1 Tax=Sinorhizobium sp. BG8 TaxID=2613773 RepID=UPI00193CAC3E|nr:glycosyltransferase [Sinorhizobium sp. BG8]QRM56644.1 hypothetical protein F3Y30_20470 [Sinorhizobium sp. BG8]
MSLAISPVAFERIRAAGKIEPTQDTVDLVFASDERYIKFTSVTLASILQNYKGKAPIRVFLLMDHVLPTVLEEYVESLKKIHPFTLHQIPVDAELFRNIKTSDGISIATYYRLLMHKLLPADARKVLYLDSDLIIRASIDELFATRFDGNLFAGVEDTISRTYNAKFGLPESAKHPNAGVLLVNVDLMRAIGFSDLIERYLESNRYRLTLGDQQILAELFFNSIKYVSPKWNVHGSMFVDGWPDQVAGVENFMCKDQARDAIRDPAIIHYTLKRKPWISLEHPKSEEWFDYLPLTPFAAEIEKPDLADATTPEAANKDKAAGTKRPAKSRHAKVPKKVSFGQYIKVILPATIVSLSRVRKTRLAVEKLKKRVEAGEEKHGAAAKKLNTLARQIDRVAKKNAPSLPKAPPMANSDVTLKSILVARAAAAAPTFNAHAAIENLSPNSMIMSNVSRKDMEGGYAENIKTVTRTSNFAFRTDRLPEAVFLLSQRIKQEMFWECVKTAYLYDLPLYFTEVALFGGFASYFDPDASLNERRALGFMIDDLGYYFDARQPSRVERTLNDPSFAQSDEERRRARAVIDRICAEKITKYNKYVEGPVFPMKPGAVLVIDQKKGDASIEFAGANDESFQQMLEAAVRENPGKPIYFKRHPDSIQRKMNSYRDRTIEAIQVLPDNVTIGSIIDRCETIYTVSSQVGFEGLMRGKKVITFGAPFYSGWGLTDDRSPIQRRRQTRTVEELFQVACIDQSVYLNPETGKLIEIEAAIDYILQMRSDNAARQAAKNALSS